MAATLGRRRGGLCIAVAILEVYHRRQRNCSCSKALPKPDCNTGLIFGSKVLRTRASNLRFPPCSVCLVRGTMVETEHLKGKSLWTFDPGISLSPIVALNISTGNKNTYLHHMSLPLHYKLLSRPAILQHWMTCQLVCGWLLCKSMC